MTTAKVEGSVTLTKRQGIVDSGEAVAACTGAMSQRCIQDFYNHMLKAGFYKPGKVDVLKVATPQLANARAGALRRSGTRGPGMCG